MSKDISKNKVFQSPYKNEIEKRLAMGSSPRSISQWLKTRGESISHVTINNYKRDFFNIDGEVSKIIKNKQEETKSKLPDNLEEAEKIQKSLLETERNKAIGTIRAINHISVLYENIQDMRQYLSKLQNYDPIVAAHAAKGLYSEMRATIEALEKIKEKEGQSDNSSVAKMLSTIKKHKRELENDARQRGQELD